MKIKPTDAHLLVDPLPEKEEKVGQIIIPNAEEKKAVKLGKVLAVGTDEEVRDMFKVDDTVMFLKFAGTVVESGGKKLRIITSDDILAVVE